MMIPMSWKDVDPSKIHRLFYPQVPVLITAEFEGRVAGMPAIWCMPLSFTPPLVGVAISPEHETHKIITGARAFTLNWMNFSFARQVGELGETSAKEQVNKLSSVGFETVRGPKTMQPLIREASACLECRLSEKHIIGTHELLVGEVVSASANADFADYWDFSKYNPLLYAGTLDREGKSWVFKSGRGETVIIPLKHGSQGP
jgi:flavin reductase (DIM6/NTAB) family NADH-FMN oxidoreductase RutF